MANHYKKDLGTAVDYRVPVFTDFRASYLPAPAAGDPPLPQQSKIVWDVDSRSLDGFNNATLSDGAALSSAVNWGSGSDAAQPTVGYRPTLSKGTGPNGIDMVVNPWSTNMNMVNSASEAKFIQNSGEFTLVAILYKDAATAPWPHGNGNGTSIKGYGAYWYGDDRGYMSIFRGSGTVAAHTTSSPVVFPEASWQTFLWRGTGTQLKASHDVGTTFTTGSAYSTFSTGDGTRDFGIGALNTGGAPGSALVGKWCRWILWSTNLSDAENGEVATHINEVYGL